MIALTPILGSKVIICSSGKYHRRIGIIVKVFRNPFLKAYRVKLDDGILIDVVRDDIEVLP